MTQRGSGSGRIYTSRAVLVACALSLAACSVAGGRSVTNRVAEVSTPNAGHLHGTEIGDVIGRPSLALRDITGSLFDLRNRSSRELTVIFFGYTRCRDVCPTTMADLAEAVRGLHADQRKHLRVVFITEDPHHDTAPVLRAWLDRFDPAFVGLIGGNATSAAALRDLKAPATEVPPVSTEQATVEHSGSVYAFLGNRVVVYTGGTTPREYAADFRELLS